MLTGAVIIIVLAPAAWGTIHQPMAGGDLIRRGVGGGGRRRARSRTHLIFSQVAITTVLLVGASVMLRSLHSLATVELGFDPRGVVAGRVSLPQEYSWGNLDLFRQRLAAFRGVDAVAFGQGVPLSGGYAISGWSLNLEGSVEEDLVRDERGLKLNRVGEDFFSVLDISLIEGRLLRADDFSRGAADPVAVVSDLLAASYWPGESAVGKGFTLPGSSVLDADEVPQDPVRAVASRLRLYEGVLPGHPFQVRRGGLIHEPELMGQQLLHGHGWILFRSVFASTVFETRGGIRLFRWARPI